MPLGASDIPDLRLSKLTKLIDKFSSAPNLKFVNRFSKQRADSDQIEWESQIGSRGMVPFKAPGAKTPQGAPRGLAAHAAKAAFMGEKMLFDEQFLNNLREPGTTNTKMNAKRKLAKELLQLRYRTDRRKEWMFVKMFSEGTFSYLEKGGLKSTVTYNIPSANKVTLTTNYKWAAGSTKDILSDIRDAKSVLEEVTDASEFTMMVTQTVLRYMVEDSGVRDLYKSSAFGRGDLFGKGNDNVLGVRTDILGTILDVNIEVIRERYTVEARLTAAVTADSTTVISVTDTEDFEVGGTLRFYDVSAGTYEDETIASIQTEAGTITVSTAPSSSYKAGEDVVSMTKIFMDDDLAVFMPTSGKVENQDIADWFDAPFGIPGTYGIKLDNNPEWDPEAYWIRAQAKGLPVLYFPEAVYILNVQ